MRHVLRRLYPLTGRVYTLALIKVFVTGQSSDTSLAASMVDRIVQLNDSLRMFHSQIQEVSMDLQEQIHNISLTPGPQVCYPSAVGPGLI